MNAKFILITCLFSCICASSQARVLDLKSTGYQLEDGAITVTFQGNYLDPYFAIRALLSAHDAGMDIQNAARDFIEWQLPRQEASGLFKRYCLTYSTPASPSNIDQYGAARWSPCANADADDALLAMWIELLYQTAPSQGLPPKWKQSVHLATQQLDMLFDKRTGIYHIATHNRVGLLMDNIEIYAAFRRIAEQQNRLGLKTQSQNSLRQAKNLNAAIQSVFRPTGQGDFYVSTQAPVPSRFYPEDVAQIFPPLFHMPVGSVTGKKISQRALQVWLAKHEHDWLTFKKDTFPWGLIALAAKKNELHATAQTWVARATSLRHSERWNVLEEAIYLSLKRER